MYILLVATSGQYQLKATGAKWKEYWPGKAADNLKFSLYLRAEQVTYNNLPCKHILTISKRALLLAILNSQSTVKSLLIIYF